VIKFYVNGGKLLYRAYTVVTEHKITMFVNSAAILPRFIEISPQYRRDIFDFYRDTTVIFGILLVAVPRFFAFSIATNI
jgi:hypothetical protein